MPLISFSLSALFGLALSFSAAASLGNFFYGPVACYNFLTAWSLVSRSYSLGAPVAGHGTLDVGHWAVGHWVVGHWAAGLLGKLLQQSLVTALVK